MLIPLAPPPFWLVSIFLTLDPPEPDAECHKLVSSDSQQLVSQHKANSLSSISTPASRDPPLYKAVEKSGLLHYSVSKCQLHLFKAFHLSIWAPAHPSARWTQYYTRHGSVVCVCVCKELLYYVSPRGGVEVWHCLPHRLMRGLSGRQTSIQCLLPIG